MRFIKEFKSFYIFKGDSKIYARINNENLLFMKKVKFIGFVILMIICQLSFSQPMFLALKNKGDSLRNEGNLKEAIVEYRKLNFQKPDDKNILYNYCCALSLFGQADSCFKYLNKYLKIDTTVRVLMDPDFCPMRREKGWNNFENYVVNLLKIKYNNPYENIQFAKEIWKLNAFDQLNFTEIEIAARKTGPNSSVVRGIWEGKFIIGQHIQQELDQLITQFGFPRKKDVGQEAVNSAFRIILHSNSNLINKHLPSIKQLCIEKELPWERYAAAYDRALWYEEKPQKYGTHTQFNELTNSEELYPLEDPEKVDLWRKELGLELLKDYLARFNIKYEPKKQ